MHSHQGFEEYTLYMTETVKRLAIIDGKSVFYRGYYAMPDLSTKDGQATGGVYGFAVMALEVIKRLHPDYVCIAWDKPKTNIRKRLAMYPAYKAGRKPAPPDFYEQIPLLHELLAAFGWPLYELDDYEADDIMGTLAVQARARGIDTALITSDLDLLQVINDNVHVYALKKGLSNIELFHPDSFEQKYGIPVEQFLDMKAIKGDSSDNIPGVPGIGEKGAVELLKQYKTLDGVYDNLALIKANLAAKLEAGKESAYLSKKLAAIWVDAPIKLDLDEVDGSTCDPQKVQEILQRFEFRTLVRQLPDVMKVPAGDQAAGVSPSGELLLPQVVPIDTDQKLQREVRLDGTTELVVHGYAAGKHGREPKLLIISPNPKTVHVIDLDKTSKQQVQEVLGPILRDPNVKKIGYDIKSTIKMFYELGIEFRIVGHDVEIGAFLLNPLRRVQTLSELAAADLGQELPDIDNMPAEELIHHAGRTIAVIRALRVAQATDLEKLPKLQELAANIDWPIVPVLAAMEHHGIQLDCPYLQSFADELRDQISDVEQQIYGHADEQFNIASPQQLAVVLFDKLGLSKTGVKKGKTGYSTAATELDKLRGLHPIINLITQFRELTKLMNTYVEPLPKMVDEASRLHTTFSLTVAQTGRLSSNDPNLQNIPVRTELGKRIRTAFVAGPGKVLIGADYSQFELRIAAVLAGDQDLIEMFNRDVDVHAATAAQIYNRELLDVTKNMRRDAKVVNFGVMYGLSPHGLSVAAGMTRDAAQTFIEKYFEVRPQLVEYIESLKQKAKTDGYTETLFGRRRPTPDVHSSNFVVREAAFRAAVNMPFQGTAADLMKMAMIDIQRHLGKKRPAARQLLQIHDSILVEAPEAEADQLAEELQNLMQNVHKLPVKLTVDTAIGKNWGEL